MNLIARPAWRAGSPLRCLLMTDTAYADLPRSRREWAEDLVQRLRSESHVPPLRGRWLAYDADDAFVSEHAKAHPLLSVAARPYAPLPVDDAACSTDGRGRCGGMNVLRLLSPLLLSCLAGGSERCRALPRRVLPYAVRHVHVAIGGTPNERVPAADRPVYTAVRHTVRSRS